MYWDTASVTSSLCDGTEHYIYLGIQDWADVLQSDLLSWKIAVLVPQTKRNIKLFRSLYRRCKDDKLFSTQTAPQLVQHRTETTCTTGSTGRAWVQTCVWWLWSEPESRKQSFHDSLLDGFSEPSCDFCDNIAGIKERGHPHQEIRNRED